MRLEGIKVCHHLAQMSEIVIMDNVCDFTGCTNCSRPYGRKTNTEKKNGYLADPTIKVASRACRCAYFPEKRQGQNEECKYVVHRKKNPQKLLILTLEQA